MPKRRKTTKPTSTVSEASSAVTTRKKKNSTAKDNDDDNNNNSDKNDEEILYTGTVEEEEDDDDNDAEDDDGVRNNDNNNNNNKKKDRMKRELHTLQEEMEIVDYGKTTTGQLRRKPTRKQAAARNQKRRKLDRQDWMESNVEYTEHLHRDGKRKKLRGSKIAIERDVIEGSVVFGGGSSGAAAAVGRRRRRQQHANDDDDDDEGLPPQEALKDRAAKAVGGESEAGEDYSDYDDDDEDGEEEEEEEAAAVASGLEDDEAVARTKTTTTTKKKKRRKRPANDDNDEDEDDDDDDDDDDETPGDDKKKKKVRGRVYASAAIRRVRRRKRVFGKLRNFKSFRMAERHGDALAEHARGNHKQAIEKLKEVARDAPSAPQVYFSLGIVYEDMFRDSRNKGRPLPNIPASTGHEAAAAGGGGGGEDSGSPSSHQDPTTATTGQGEAENNNINNTAGSPPGGDESSAAEVPDNLLLRITEQIDMAKRAYGSYHIAAILCKRDYTIWLRAADLAYDIADLHCDASLTRSCINDAALREQHTSERQRWLGEARNDYKIADKLSPPGIDVPAKLATVLVELGCLSEALTILTDLKNRPPSAQGRRSDFESSYRAWLLYADLMLKVGHECTKWNNGIETNKNYMFRRWLRKQSSSFDWQERRMQSLVKALEAAAGSKCCEKLLSWLKKRVSSPASQSSASDGASTTDNGDLLNGGGTNIDKELEHEKELLVKTNQSELMAFDKTTEEISRESNLKPSKEREKGRAQLIQRQNIALSELEEEYKKKNESKSSQEPRLLLPKDADPDEYEAGELSPTLPISGSVKVVCDIASQLIRLMLGLRLYDGGALVGEAVSSYLKERSRIVLRRSEAQRSRDDQSQQLLGPMLALQGQAYDEDKSDDESDVPLSDDEELMVNDQSPLITSMRKGALSPELSVLYALSLIGQGGKNFVALKFLEAIRALEREPCSWFSQNEPGLSSSGDSSWVLEKQKATAPLGRFSALVLVADTLQVSGKEKVFAARVSDLFSTELEFLTREGIINNILTDIEGSGSVHELQSQQIVKYIQASARYQLELAATRIAESKLENTLLLVKTPIDSLSKLLDRLWVVKPTFSVSSLCIDLLRTIARAFRLLCQYQAMSRLQGPPGLDILEQIKGPVEIVCSCSQLKLTALAGEESVGFGDFPLRSAWQSIQKHVLSLSALNLCAACNVGTYSGWNKQPFKIPHPNSSFDNSWMHVSNEVLCGLLCEFEDDIAEQWDILQNELAVMPSFKFREQLKTLRQTSWYKQAKAEKEATSTQQKPIALYGEHYGLSLLLSFSRFCLLIAKESKEAGVGDKAMKDSLVCTSLSIILPVSQFCIKQRLWDSPLGFHKSRTVATVREKNDDVRGQGEGSSSSTTARAIPRAPSAGSRGKYGTEQQEKERHNLLFDHTAKAHAAEQLQQQQRALRQQQGQNDDVKRQKQQEALLKRQQQKDGGTKDPALIRKKDLSLHGSFWGEDCSSILSNTVALPCSVLLEVWRKRELSGEEQSTVGDEARPSARDLMSEVNNAIRQLRLCHTEKPVEKASLDVSIALLNLVSCPDCENPFLCLQQSVLFASMSPKLGMSDAKFKEALPKSYSCTPTTALVILGRAECLSALHFCEEAAFLCSYVASVCRFKREQTIMKNKLEGDQWKIIRIIAYNTSVAVRHTAKTLLNKKDEEKESLRTWKCIVIDELMLGRSDGLVMMKKTKTKSTISSTAPLKEQGKDSSIQDSTSAAITENDGDVHNNTVSPTLLPGDSDAVSGGCVVEPIKGDGDGDDDSASAISLVAV